MRYIFINGVVTDIVDKSTDKIATPIIGYILQDNVTKQKMLYSRKEAFDRINEYGAENVEAKSRVNGKGETCYYLELKDKSKKINEFIINYKDNTNIFTTSFVLAMGKLFGWTWTDI